MKKIIFSMIIAATILFILFILNKSFFKKTQDITINEKTFNVKIAKTADQKEKGLSIYNSLKLNEGMIFTFEKADFYTFWMKDMKFPIDIIYINDGKIVDIFENVPYPKSKNEKLEIIRPRNVSETVLEINSELSSKYNFKIGDKVKSNFNL